ncbi:uncharacterized protein TNCV_126161 [Trichonephila clavipes]|nr:uncharacterized protein TNCV_126161 [Trichonephila clavipes]
MNLTWRNPPAHHWYAAKNPGLSIQCRRSRAHQTALARLRSRHLRSMTFVQGAVRRDVLLARWIVQSVLLETVGSSRHEKVPTREKPGLEQPERPRRERIAGSYDKHLWTPQ